MGFWGKFLAVSLIFPEQGFLVLICVYFCRTRSETWKASSFSSQKRTREASPHSGNSRLGFGQREECDPVFRSRKHTHLLVLTAA
uniref:Uncharacterized protein n=1 Tax=Brassica oleracea TaxID=3712 RepID=A0A3P6FPC6_BRAOL|nr:unnamed protein product [Brassica oleracea]